MGVGLGGGGRTEMACELERRVGSEEVEVHGAAARDGAEELVRERIARRARRVRWRREAVTQILRARWTKR